jgi:hypothetical protein
MIPPLSQSRQSQLSCPLSYVEQQIRGHKAPQSEAARRGQIIHQTLCTYVRNLGQDRGSGPKRAKDPGYFICLLKGLPPDVREILEPQAERIEFDPEQVYATELHCTMDADFRANVLESNASYDSTLDLVLVHESTRATIIDWKSQFAAIDPDTFQARLYSLQLFMLNPQFERVTFELRFVRWGGKARSVTFTREQVPELQQEARRWRELQIKLHQEKRAAGALPGTHCVYCPLLANGCPVEDNPAGDPKSMLAKVLYFREAIKGFSATLKTHCDEHGPISVKDGVGNEYRAEWGIGERKRYPLDALPVIQKWDKQREKGFMQNLSISGLGTPLRARKREDLADELANYVEVKTVPKFRIGKVGEAEEENGDS